MSLHLCRDFPRCHIHGIDSSSYVYMARLCQFFKICYVNGFCFASHCNISATWWQLQIIFIFCRAPFDFRRCLTSFLLEAHPDATMSVMTRTANLPICSPIDIYLYCRYFTSLRVRMKTSDVSLKALVFKHHKNKNIAECSDYISFKRFTFRLMLSTWMGSTYQKEQASRVRSWRGLFSNPYKQIPA